MNLTTGIEEVSWTNGDVISIATKNYLVRSGDRLVGRDGVHLWKSEKYESDEDRQRERKRTEGDDESIGQKRKVGYQKTEINEEMQPETDENPSPNRTRSESICPLTIKQTMPRKQEEYDRYDCVLMLFSDRLLKLLLCILQTKVCLTWIEIPVLQVEKITDCFP